MMKSKLTAGLLAVLMALTALLPAMAGAEIIGRPADGYMHRYVADNGQEICFVSSSEEALVETDADVNFDGYPDLAVVTSLGASNAWYEFYLWEDGKYVFAERETDSSINYSLAGGKYLVSWSNDGSAGLLFHAQVCRWDGNVLKLVRAMTSEEETVTTWEGDTMTTTMHTDRLHVTVWENAADGTQVIRWEKTYSPLPEDAAAFDEMDAHLWEGLEDN